MERQQPMDPSKLLEMEQLVNAVSRIGSATLADPTNIVGSAVEGTRVMQEVKDSLGDRVTRGMNLNVNLTQKFRFDDSLSRSGRRLGRFIEGHFIQTIVVVLLIIDVLVVLCELVLEAEVLRVELQIAEHLLEEAINGTHAMMTHAARAAATHIPHMATHVPDMGHGSGFDVHLAETILHRLESAEVGLHWTSISILCLFMIELFTLMFAFAPKRFFTHRLYVIDIIVVSVSLVMEVTFYELRDQLIGTAVSLLVLIRVWRIVRVGHGLVITAEEKHSETRIKLQKERLKTMMLQADIHEYMLEAQVYEELLEHHNIEKPHFGMAGDKFHPSLHLHMDTTPTEGEEDMDEEQQRVFKETKETIERNHAKHAVRREEIRQERGFAHLAALQANKSRPHGQLHHVEVEPAVAAEEEQPFVIDIFPDSTEDSDADSVRYAYIKGGKTYVMKRQE